MAKKDLNAAPEVTPENTPVPGGGRWRWDITKPGWVEVDENGALVPATPVLPDPAALVALGVAADPV
jgi:hypothetical protein